MFSKVQNSNLGLAISSVRSRIRPWVTDFGAVSQFTRPGDDWATRLRINVTYYKGNYGIIFTGFVVYSIISNPFLLVSIILLLGAWSWLLGMRPRLEDGSIAPVTVGGRVLSGFEQKVALGSFTFILMMITSLGSTIFWALGASMFFIVAHAITHKTDMHEVDAEQFGVPGQFTPADASA